MPLDPNKANLDPQAKALLDFLAQAGRVPINQVTPALARAQFAELAARTCKQGKWEVVVSDRDIPGPSGRLGTRLYRPRAAGTEALPGLIFFHGGGWCIGSLETHDAVCRQLAEEAQCAVLSVDYRLAPEHRFPAAVEDCFAAVTFASSQGKKLDLDPTRLAVGGDSAGGNLAAVSAILARDRGLPLVGQLLIYPATDFIGAYPSREDFAEGYLLTQEGMEWFAANYLSDAERRDWRASPLLAPDLRRLPPAIVIVGACDPLRDESEAYAEKLKAAGNEVTFHLIPGQIHGFFGFGGVIAAADQAIGQAAQFLRRVLWS